MKRGDYATINDNDIKHFESILSSSRCITDKSDIEPYNVDFLGAVRGYSQVLLKPKTTEEVSAILKHCNSRKLAVASQGGNTGTLEIVRTFLIISLKQNSIFPSCEMIFI